MTHTLDTPPPLGPDLFWEKQAATSLGISRTRMRAMRKSHLQPESDWQLRDNAVVLTTAGLAKIQRALATEPAQAISATISAGGVSTPSPVAEQAASAAGGGAAVPPGPPPKALFMVVRIPPGRVDRPQRHVLLCRETPPGSQQIAPWQVARVMPQLGPERAVRVRDNVHFLPGMVLEAIEIGHGLWQYAGRLPRRQGRW